MTAQTILNIYLILFAIYVVIEVILSLLNIKEAKSTNGKLPDFLIGQVEEETFNRSVEYTLAKEKLALFSHLYLSIILLLLLCSGILGSTLHFFENIFGASYTAAVFFILSLELFFDIISWSLQLLMTFKVEASFGFNKMTLQLWITDKLKNYLLSIFISVPLLYAIFWFVDICGALWWVYAAALTISFNLLIVYVHPIWIAPLFNKFTPLKDAALKEKILSLAERLNFSLVDVFEMDGSKRSAHANAYFTGFGKNRRVVLFDTLCDLLKENEILAVLAHEIGHMKKKHILKGLILSCSILVFSFWLIEFSLHYPNFFNAFGFDKPSSAAALALLLFFSAPVVYFLTLSSAILSRRFEYQADAFAKVACNGSEDLANALIALSKKSLSNYLPHPLYIFFHYTHPPLRERLKALREEQ